MPNQFTRADAVREYLTGALIDGDLQTNPSISLGGYRSSTEVASLGIQISNPITGAAVQYAGGENPTGVGTLTALDAATLVWRPFTASSNGPAVSFGATGDVRVIEALNNPGQFLRVQGTLPFSGGPSQITLTELANNLYGFDNVSIADAAAGSSFYRAGMIRNESAGSVTSFKRWLRQLGTRQDVSVGGGLSSSGAGVITTTGHYSDWPDSGYCQVRTAAGVVREVVYYSSKTSTMLNVPASGRALFGTVASAGALGDRLYAVPGAVIAKDPTGARVFGSSIQTIANQNTTPAGVTWNFGIDDTTALSIGTLAVGQQIGLWMWRHVPAGMQAGPLLRVGFEDSFISL